MEDEEQHEDYIKVMCVKEELKLLSPYFREGSHPHH